MKKFLSAITAMLMSVSCLQLFPVGAVEENLVEGYATGLIWESAEEFAAKTGTQVIDTSTQIMRTALPSQFDITDKTASHGLGKYFPPIGDQGTVPSCVAWATTYYHYTYEVNRFKGEATTADNTYSPTWTFNYICANDFTNSNQASAYNVLYRQGAMKHKDLAYNPDRNTYISTWPTDMDKMIDALEYRTTYDSFFINSVQDLQQLKTLLSQGKLATVGTHPSGWTIRQITGTSHNGELIVVRSSSAGDGHCITVVGYDDNIEVEVNGETLTGALKIANSEGEGFANQGYIWIAYDSLFLTSSHGPLWDDDMPGTRSQVFSNFNETYYIENVFRSDVKFVGYVEFNTRAPWLLTIKGNSGNSANSIKYQSNTSFAYTNPGNRFIVFDYFDADGSYDMNNFLSSTWTMTLTGSTYYTTNGIKSMILDSLGNTIAGSYNQSGTLTNGSYTKQLTTQLAKGRVTAYDNHEITSADAEKVLNYLVGNVELSNLQLFLADYRSDGEVNIQDVIAMNQHISSLSGQSYQITDYIEEWGYSLADVIEEEYDTTIEEYVAENYAELSAMNVIPTELREDVYAY